MGLRIFCTDEAAPYPRPVVLELVCDGDHGLFTPEAVLFDEADGFIAQHTTAMRAGWLETHDARGRIFLGPCCSGKRANA